MRSSLNVYWNTILGELRQYSFRTAPFLVAFEPGRRLTTEDTEVRGTSCVPAANGLHKELAARARLCDIHTMHICNRWTLILWLLATSAAGLWAQEKSDAATVRALELKWTESYKQHNIDILSSLLSDEFVITIEDGSIYSKAGYITHSADSAVHVQVAELSDLKVRLHGDTAIVTGAYHEKGESKGRPYEYHDRLTDVWMKIGGKWQVIASHYSIPSKE